MVKLYAGYAFLLRYARPDGGFRNSPALGRWLRVAANLTESKGKPQAEDLFRMVRAVSRLVEDGFALRCMKALPMWPTMPDALSAFPASQVVEEAVKAALMQRGGMWKRCILEAENSFLGGRIDMLLSFAGIGAEEVFPGRIPAEPKQNIYQLYDHLVQPTK